LLADDTVPGTRIDVDSDGGVVTLSGRLPTQAQVERALAITRGIEGVERVENRLTVDAAG
jgi:hyperosmotically inducible protein